jgi:aldehyde dehydrogenase (NAD+)
MHDAGVPAGVFNLVNGEGPEVGARWPTHPDVDMISITGSTRAGVLVAQAGCADRQARRTGTRRQVTQRDPARRGSRTRHTGRGGGGHAQRRPVLQRADPHHRAARAPGEVERLAYEAASALVVGDPRHRRRPTARWPTAHSSDRVQEMIGVGIAEGARLVCGGPGRPQGLERGYYVRPTIFSDVKPPMRIAQEEIFGPVLGHHGLRSLDEAVEIA